MDTNQRFQENLQLFRDAVQMKKTSRVPFFSTDAFWRFQDCGYTLTECMTDHEKLNEANCQFAERYKFDCLLDVGDRNPYQFITTLGNEQYQIDDKNNTLVVEEQNHFSVEDYDLYLENPLKDLWENIIPRKYTKFNSEMTAADLVSFLGQFLAHNAFIERTGKDLAARAGTVPLSLHRVYPPVEVMINFLRGFRGIGMDMRRRPEKLDKLIEFMWNPADLDGIRPISETPAAFSTMTIMLGQNLMNPKQFERFYWPHLKAISDKLEEVDGTCFILSEGTTVHVTEYLKQLAPHRFCLYVETDDIFERREALPDMCLLGGLPISMLGSATPEECVAHAKKVIEVVGKNGGLILAPNKFMANPNDCTRENLLAISEFINSMNY